MTDPVPSLSALYQAEKADASLLFNTAMAMMGVAVAYLVGAIPFVQKKERSWIFLILLPFPLWIILAFHSLITLDAMSHGNSVRILENALFESSGLGAVVNRDMVGSAAADKIMVISQESPIHHLVTLFVYGGVGLLVILFTSYSLYSAKKLVRARVIWVAASAYFLVVLMVGSSWFVGLRMIDKDSKAISSQARIAAANGSRGDTN